MVFIPTSYLGGGGGSGAINTISLPNPLILEDAISVLPGGNSQGSTFIGTDNFIYYVGGRGSGNTDAIWKAPKSDPTSWTDTGSTLNAPLFAAWSYTVGGKAYLVAGRNGSTDQTAIYSADLTDLTSWTTEGNVFPIARFISYMSDGMCFVGDDYIWIYGSRGTTNAHTEIFRAPIGDPTNWVDSGLTLPTTVAASGFSRVGDLLIAVGGMNAAGTELNIIQSASVSDPGNWYLADATFPRNIQRAVLTVIGDRVYCFGGYDGGAVLDIYSAPVSNPFSWTKTGAVIPRNFQGTQMMYDGAGTVFFCGMEDGGHLDKIYKTSFTVDGVYLGDFKANSNTVPVHLKYGGGQSSLSSNERYGIRTDNTDVETNDTGNTG